MSTLLAAGDKKLQTSLFSYFTGVDYEGAVDLYEQAANTLKGQRDFQGAASVYIHKLLPIAEKAGASRWQQSKWWDEAAKNLKHVDEKLMVAPVKRAVELLKLDNK